MKRLGANVQVALNTPNNVTNYVYLYNSMTTNYELVQTIAGTGAMTTVTTSLDVTATSPYISNNTVQVLVRALKPLRFGTTPFTLSLDQVVVTERDARTSG